MTRYEKVKSLIESTRPEDRIFCKSKGACACRGCLTSKGVRPHELDLFNAGKL